MAASIVEWNEVSVCMMTQAGGSCLLRVSHQDVASDEFISPELRPTPTATQDIPTVRSPIPVCLAERFLHCICKCRRAQGGVAYKIPSARRSSCSLISALHELRFFPAQMGSP